jgi:hypothetical protein
MGGAESCEHAASCEGPVQVFLQAKVEVSVQTVARSSSSSVGHSYINWTGALGYLASCLHEVVMNRSSILAVNRASIIRSSTPKLLAYSLHGPIIRTCSMHECTEDASRILLQPCKRITGGLVLKRVVKTGNSAPGGHRDSVRREGLGLGLGLRRVQWTLATALRPLACRM